MRDDLDNDIRRGTIHPLEGRGNGEPGKILERVLKLKGDNRAASDGNGIEAKWHGGDCLITLLHKTPEGGVETITPAIRRYGKLREDGVLSLRDPVRVGTKHRNPPKFAIVPGRDGSAEIRAVDGTLVAAWPRIFIERSVAGKLQNVLIVYGHHVKDVSVQFKSYRYCTNFCGIDKFMQAILNGVITLEFDARMRPEETSPRDRGTKMRVAHKNIGVLWEDIEEQFNPPPLVKRGRKPVASPASPIVRPAPPSIVSPAPPSIVSPAPVTRVTFTTTPGRRAVNLTPEEYEELIKDV